MSQTMAIQHQADCDQRTGKNLQDALTNCNDQMATIARQEAQTLLGKLVSLAFKQERLQF